MKHTLFLLTVFLLLTGCNTKEYTEHERVNAEFKDSLGGDISPMHWWRTAVTIKINVEITDRIRLWLMSEQEDADLYDYKELNESGTITMTAPQGQGNTLFLCYMYKKNLYTQEIHLTGKPEEIVTLNALASKKYQPARTKAPAESLFGSSINGDAIYYQFTEDQLHDFFTMMELSRNNVDAKTILGLNCDYELESNGPFYITWANGHESSQLSRILGYYFHSPETYEDIKYVDLSETHKWDYIDSLAKVQYKFGRTCTYGSQTFEADTWYDANFDLNDNYGSTYSMNMDRIGDNAYNIQEVYNHYKKTISALRGISFKVDVPKGMRIGFFLRSDEEPYPSQWNRLQKKGVAPYVNNRNYFMGTCFSAEALNVDGKHRSFIIDYDNVIWMGMEDVLEGGDYDCNDVVFGVVSELDIYKPEIVSPGYMSTGDHLFPWTIAYEDVNRDADFDFNDAVIKIMPDYESEQCCVTVEAAGSPARMYLHYDGPDGDQVLGEMHELLNGEPGTIINTKGSVASTPFVQIDCVPWPNGYTVANDAKRFYIEIQRGTCDDCTDFITLADKPGQSPEALLVAGEWEWPMEGRHIFSSYNGFPNWSKDVTKMNFWEWYKWPVDDSSVAF